MKKVVVAGVGIHPFGRFDEKPVSAMAIEAVMDALGNANMEYKNIQTAFVSRVFAPPGTGVRALSEIGRTGIPVIEVEAACAGGGACLRQGYNAIVSGMYDIVLCLGVEKMPRGFMNPEIIVEPWQAKMGLSQSPVVWALLARRRMHDYGLTIEQICRVAVKNHKNGQFNPNAYYRKAMSLEEILNSTVVADPLRLYAICAPNEGAAAVVLCSEKAARRFTTKTVEICSCAHVVSKSPWNNISGYDWDLVVPQPHVTALAGKQAYEAAGIGPKDISVAEVQDTEACQEIEAYEYLGFCGEGEGGQLVDKGATEIDGRIPVNASGGLICKGEPVGASGLGQVHEIVLQLRGEAGQRQVTNPKVGLAHVFGSFGHCTVTILKK